MTKGTRSRASGWGAGCRAAVGVALCLAGRAALSVEPPVAPQVSSGSYTVSYQSCLSCLTDWLEERVGDSGQWTVVGAGTATYSSKAEGRYYYRVAYLYLGAHYSSFIDYSPATTVMVASVVPGSNPIEAQLSYRYEARRGDINGDGKTDLFVARVSGGAAGDGTIDKVLLRQAAGGRFTVAAATPAEARTAASWSIAAVRILLKDVNVDGFADLVLGRVAAAVGASGLLNQIVYAPGELLRTAPRGINAVDSAFRKFTTDTASYLREPQYFADNATYRTVTYTYFQYMCDDYGSLDYYGYGYYASCFPFPVTVVAVYPDFSVFSSNAVSIWSYESAIERREISTKLGLDKIEGLLESFVGAGVGIGGWTDREILDKQRPIKSVDYRRGLEIFTALLRMGEAGAAEPDDPATTRRDTDAVYITGRRIIGFLPIHTALEYRGSTISAYDSIDGFFNDGTLVSQVDWVRDHPRLMMTLGTVRGALTPSLYWARLLAADGRYRDNLPYDALPSIGRAGYNSNGYGSGIVQATAGLPSISMARFPGGEKPVPPSAFR